MRKKTESDEEDELLDSILRTLKYHNSDPAQRVVGVILGHLYSHEYNT